MDVVLNIFKTKFLLLLFYEACHIHYHVCNWLFPLPPPPFSTRHTCTWCTSVVAFCNNHSLTPLSMRVSNSLPVGFRKGNEMETQNDSSFYHHPWHVLFDVNSSVQWWQIRIQLELTINGKSTRDSCFLLSSHDQYYNLTATKQWLSLSFCIWKSYFCKAT